MAVLCFCPLISQIAVLMLNMQCGMILGVYRWLAGPGSTLALGMAF